MINTIITTCSFGLESILAHELRALGYNELQVENGRVTLAGDDEDVARCNIWLRTADRVLIQMARFTAEDFEQLFQGTLEVPWEDIIPVNGEMHVTGKSVKSTLHSVPGCQSIVKKAVVESMKRKYKQDWFDENGPVYKIEVALLKDEATLSIDTSGAGLHKRGYRRESGEAPLRETLAAALVLMSRWGPSRVFADPLAGSGTIAIEAAMIGRNQAPGINREFTAESWPHVDEKIWEKVREEARQSINTAEFTIFASDPDWSVFKIARENALLAGISENITFQKKPVEDFGSRNKYGCIVTNPPYGERIGEKREVESLYRTMGQVFSKLDTWSFFILTAHEDFQKYFGKKADKNRKLYNGRLKCYLYQYLGPLPPKQ